MKTKNTVEAAPRCGRSSLRGGQGASTTNLDKIGDGKTDTNFNIVRKVKTLIFILLSALISIGASAQSSISRIGVFIDSKAHIRNIMIASSKAYSSDDKDIVIIKYFPILKNGDKKAYDNVIKSTWYSKELEPDKRYMIYIIKPGYDPKSLEVSTVGALPGYKYVFHAEITLDKEGEANYDEEVLETYVEYDKFENGFTMVNK